MLVVVGMPRTRTSALMQSLHLMGKNVFGGFQESDMCPGGNGESLYSPVGMDTSFFKADVAIKIILDAFLFRSTIHPEDRIIYCLRAPAGMAWSQAKHHLWKPPQDVRRMNYWRLQAQFIEWMKAAPNPVLIVDTDEMMTQPEKWMHAVGQFVGVENVGAAVQNIKPALTMMGHEEIEDDAYRVYQELRACSATT